MGADVTRHGVAIGNLGPVTVVELMDGDIGAHREGGDHLAVEAGLF